MSARCPPIREMLNKICASWTCEDFLQFTETVTATVTCLSCGITYRAQFWTTCDVEPGSAGAAATRPERIRVLERYIEAASIQPDEQWRSRLEIDGITEHVRFQLYGQCKVGSGTSAMITGVNYTRTKCAKRNYWVKVAYPYKETTRRPHKPLSKQWLPAISYGKHDVHPDSRAAVEGFNNEVTIGLVQHILEVSHCISPAPLALVVCELYEPEERRAAHQLAQAHGAAGGRWVQTAVGVITSSLWSWTTSTRSGVSTTLVTIGRDRIPAGLLDQLFCNKPGCTSRVQPQQTPGSQLGYDVADLPERTTPNTAEWDGNTTELASCGFTVTDDEATGELTVSSAGPTSLLTNDTGVARSLLDEVPAEYGLARGILGQHYRNGNIPPPNALCTEVKTSARLLPVAESVPPPSRGVVRVSDVSSRPPKSRVALPLADATNRPSHAIVELHAALTTAGSKSIRHNASAVTAAAKAADAAAANVEEEEQEADSSP
eukprot:jgi/Tetstr1/440280/TSEL_028630.t1